MRDITRIASDKASLCYFCVYLLKFPTEWKLAPDPVSPSSCLLPHSLAHSLLVWTLSLSLCQCLSWDSINALPLSLGSRTDTAATIDLSISDEPWSLECFTCQRLNQIHD